MNNIRDFLDSLSTESVFKYSSSAQIKDLLLGIARAGMTAYKDAPDDVTQQHNVVSETLEEASQLMRKHTGVGLTLRLRPLRLVDDNSSGYTVEVQIPKMALTPSSMYPKLTDAQMDAVINGTVLHTVKGNIDLKTVKVSGVYSDIQFNMDLGLHLFSPGFLTEEELAAVLAHELGHILDFLINLGEVGRCYAIHSYTNKVLNGNYTLEKKFDVIRALDPQLASAVDDPSSMDQGEVGALVASHAFARRRSMDSMGIYSKNMEEYLADEFAAMHGLGYAVATAMRKIEGTQFFFTRNKEYRPIWLGALAGATEVSEAFAIGYGIAAGSSMGLTFGSLLLLPILQYSLPMFGDRIPVKPSDRIRKMRQALTSALRDSDISESDRRAILKDIDALNRELAELSKGWASTLDYVREYIFKFMPTSKAKQNYYTQTNLDSLGNNRLHELANRLQLG